MHIGIGTQSVGAKFSFESLFWTPLKRNQGITFVIRLLWNRITASTSASALASALTCCIDIIVPRMAFISIDLLLAHLSVEQEYCHFYFEPQLSWASSKRVPEIHYFRFNINREYLPINNPLSLQWLFNVIHSERISLPIILRLNGMEWNGMADWQTKGQIQLAVSLINVVIILSCVHLSNGCCWFRCHFLYDTHWNTTWMLDVVS